MHPTCWEVLYRSTKESPTSWGLPVPHQHPVLPWKWDWVIFLYPVRICILWHFILHCRTPSKWKMDYHFVSEQGFAWEHVNTGSTQKCITFFTSKVYFPDICHFTLQLMVVAVHLWGRRNKAFHSRCHGTGLGDTNCTGLVLLATSFGMRLLCWV
jgi:hypothetical protein